MARTVHAGDMVYRLMMDLSLTLQDMEVMAPVRLLLAGIPEDTAALAALRVEVCNLQGRLNRMADATRASQGAKQTTQK